MPPSISPSPPLHSRKAEPEVPQSRPPFQAGGSFAACGPADRGIPPSDLPERVIFTKKYLEILADKPKKMSTQKVQIVI